VVQKIMSTAILISGQLRTFAKCWPTQRWHVLRHFADPHFFISVQAGPEWHEILAPLMAEFPNRVHVDLKADPDLSAHLTPELSAAYHQAPYTNAAPAHQLLLQHWYQAACWRQFQERVLSLGFGVEKFDTIIRMRADLWFHSFEAPESVVNTWPEFISPGIRTDGLISNTVFTPWWGRFGGINDRFAIMGPEAAKYYFNVFEHIPELLAAGCPFHPESLVKANLERGNIDLHETLRTEFSTLRTTGEMRHWLSEVLPTDLAHARAA
jgi:hypothetical protein